MFKKIFVLAIVLPVITGCIRFATPQEKALVLGTFVFENENFTMRLPGDFQTEEELAFVLIKPKQNNEFPEISVRMASFKADPTIEEILQNEKTILASLCGQTDTCGKITDWKMSKINGKIALKYTVLSKGRALGDQQGFLYGHNVAFPFSKKSENPKEPPQSYLLRFSISATDLEEPGAEELFDKIIRTVKFK